MEMNIEIDRGVRSELPIHTLIGFQRSTKLNKLSSLDFERLVYGLTRLDFNFADFTSGVERNAGDSARYGYHQSTHRQ